jgi:hypothetical protein
MMIHYGLVMTFMNLWVTAIGSRILFLYVEDGYSCRSDYDQIEPMLTRRQHCLLAGNTASNGSSSAGSHRGAKVAIRVVRSSWPATAAGLASIRIKAKTHGAGRGLTKLCVRAGSRAVRAGCAGWAGRGGSAASRPDSDAQCLMHWLEFKHDDEFAGHSFGGIGGGATMKYGIYQRQSDGAWMGGAPIRPHVLSIDHAIAKARQQRGELLTGSKVLAALNAADTRLPASYPSADEAGQIPLLFLCSPNKFPCSAGIFPLFGRVAELERKPLI